MMLLMYFNSALRIFLLHILGYLDTLSSCLFSVLTCIVFSSDLVVDAASHLTMGGCIAWSSVLMGYVCQYMMLGYS